MTLTVSTYHPRVSVSFFKNTGSGSIEIGPGGTGSTTTGEGVVFPQYDVIEINTHKDLAEVAGTFSIKLTARRDSRGRTWAHLIEPMDYAVIRMTRKFSRKAEDVTVIMRGFVDVSQLVISAAADGSPETYVLIEGRDYGKLFLRAFYFMIADNGSHNPIPGSASGQIPEGILSSNLQLTETIMDPEEWLRKLWKEFTDPKYDIAAIPPGAPALDIAVGASLKKYGIYKPMSGPFTGSIWNYLSNWESKPYWEMFVTDDVEPAKAANGSSQEGKPTLIWRRNAAKKYADAMSAPPGSATKGNTEDPDTAQQFPPMPNLSYHADVISHQVGRHDQEAYTFFLALPIPDQMSSNDWWSIASDLAVSGGVSLFNSTLSKRFGFLPLDPQLQLFIGGRGSNDPITNNDTQARAQEQEWFPALKDLTKWLRDAYSENYLFEQGSLIIKGTAEAKIGRYVTIDPTGQEFYIEAVDHNFRVDPLNYTSSLTVTRGRWPQGHIPYTTFAREGSPFGLPAGSFASPQPESAPGPNPTTTTPSPCHAVPPFAGSFPCTQAFGQTAWESPHAGIDLATPTGTHLFSPVDGVVTTSSDTNAATGPDGHLGNYIIITAANGDTWVLAHLLHGTLIGQGQHVNAGQQVAQSGNSGNSTGPHLHLEYHPQGGAAADPSGCLTGFAGKCPDGFGHMK